MAIAGKQNINIGLPNESTGSDSLYTAFNKAKNNFDNLFANASPNITFANGLGTFANFNSGTNTLRIENKGVCNIIAGTNITVSPLDANGNITISSSGGGGGGGGTVTSVAVYGAGSNARITSSGGPITSTGVITLDLVSTGVTPGSYTYPSMTVDTFGRVTAISNGVSLGTVTSVGISPGSGIQVTGSPVTTSGTMTITNTGVTRLTAGTGISLSGSNGEVTVSTTAAGGTVTSVSVSSSTLTVTGSPITTTGTIGVEIPSNVAVTGRFLLSGSENLADATAANLLVTASYFTTTGASTATLAAGTNGLVKTFMMVADGGDMVITVTNPGWGGSGTMTFGDVGDGCTLQYINNKWYCIGNNGVVFA
jgi:hypothetical protein